MTQICHLLHHMFHSTVISGGVKREKKTKENKIVF